MGAAAAERARAEFDERRVVGIVLDTYRRVAARKRRTAIIAALDDPAGGPPVPSR
jgi:hypothetical protein